LTASSAASAAIAAMLEASKPDMASELTPADTVPRPEVAGSIPAPSTGDPRGSRDAWGDVVRMAAAAGTCWGASASSCSSFCMLLCCSCTPTWSCAGWGGMELLALPPSPPPTVLSGNAEESVGWLVLLSSAAVPVDSPMAEAAKPASTLSGRRPEAGGELPASLLLLLLLMSMLRDGTRSTASAPDPAPVSSGDTPCTSAAVMDSGVVTVVVVLVGVGPPGLVGRGL
jgi:hypothetical protein